MALGALTGALISMGAGDLAKDLTKSAGGALLGHISDKIGIPVGDPGFDAAAAAHVEAMGLQDLEQFRIQTQDVQHARAQTQFADLVKWLAIGLSVVYVLVMIALFFFSNEGDLSPWAEANLNQMISVLNNLLIATWAFFFGSSVGSKTKDEQKAVEEAREDEMQAMQTRVIAQMPVERVAPVVPAAAAVEDDLFAPDMDDGNFEELVSTERRPS